MVWIVESRILYPQSSTHRRRTHTHPPGFIYVAFMWYSFVFEIVNEITEWSGLFLWEGGGMEHSKATNWYEIWQNLQSKNRSYTSSAACSHTHTTNQNDINSYPEILFRSPGVMGAWIVWCKRWDGMGCRRPVFLVFVHFGQCAHGACGADWIVRQLCKQIFRRPSHCSMAHTHGCVRFSASVQMEMVIEME